MSQRCHRAPKRPLLRVLPILCSLIACGGTTDDGPREWIRDWFDLRSTTRVVRLIVVDDTDTEETAAFRERLVAPFARVMEREAFWTPGTFYDPAAWHPVDYRVVIGYPSAGVEQRYRTS